MWLVPNKYSSIIKNVFFLFLKLMRFTSLQKNEIINSVYSIFKMSFVSSVKENEQVEEAGIGHSNYLATKNAHSRDAFIRFYEVGHRYEITIIPKDTTKYTSATTWNHAHFYSTIVLSPLQTFPSIYCLYSIWTYCSSFLK